MAGLEIGTILNSAPMIWLLLAIALAIIEAFTLGLTTIWFAAGSLAALVVALLGGPGWLQIAIFLVVSIVLLYFTKPLADKKFQIGREKNNLDQMIGGIGLVVEEILPYGVGLVKFAGQTWTAISTDNQTLNNNQEVVVVRIEGVKLIVESKGE